MKFSYYNVEVAKEIYCDKICWHHDHCATCHINDFLKDMRESILSGQFSEATEI